MLTFVAGSGVGSRFVPSCALVAMCAVAASACTAAPAGPSTVPPPNASTTSTPPSPDAGRPFAFTVRHEQLVDTTRPTATPGDPAYSPTRTLPTDLYIPTTSTPRPLIMFSHGYHGAPRKFSHLFRAGRAGYIVAACGSR
jgi:hypothetical protein